jgi:hypothetical protein
VETTDVIETLEGVLKIIHENNELQSQGRIKDRAENATEVLMDAQVIKLGHDIMCAAMQRMGNNEFNDDEFAQAIVSFSICSQKSHTKISHLFPEPCHGR